MNVYIAALSDMEQDAERKLRWGDYWFKDSLGKALEAQGHTVVGDVVEADVLINLHGGRIQQLPEWTWNVLWIIGHPDAVTEQECDEYDVVYSESAMFAEHVREWGIACKHLPGASDFEPLELPKTHDAVFVGNWREGRTLDDGLPTGHRLEVWGEGWEGHLPEGAEWRGLYYPHEDLAALYASSVFVIPQMYEDMHRWGFVNPRIHDVLAVRGEKVPTFAECAERIMADVPAIRGMLDLGCGEKPRRGMVGIDRLGGEDVIPWDLEMGLPAHECADVIVADNLLEHIDNLIPLMNDCHEALLPGGRMHVVVPNAQNLDDAWADPTHRRAFVPGTFDYFNGEHGRWQMYGKGYGIKPWRVVYCRAEGRFIRVMMRPMEWVTYTVRNEAVANG